MVWSGRLTTWLSALTLIPAVATAQEPAAPADAVNLFFDCQAPGCYDLDYLRREVSFVNWVRDREAADVHVLVTAQGTGGGGQFFTLDFIGLRGFEGEDQQLTHSTPGDATTDEQRGGTAEMLKVGLVRYVAGTSAAARLRVSLAGAPGGAGEPGPGGAPGGPEGGPPGAVSQTDDPWDFWNFRINWDGYINGEATYRQSFTYGQFEADRTTEAWKLNLGVDFNRNVQKFEIDDEDEPSGFRTVEETREDWGVSTTLVRSIGERWAVGLRTDAGSSTYYNQDYRIGAKPGVEFNFLPYSESSRRSITLQYLVGPNHWNYTFPTIFEETSETRVQESLTARVALIEPWGRWTTSLTAAHYLHDTSKSNVTLSGNFNIRLFRGFSIRMGGNYSWIRDQLYLSAGSATQEEILLRQTQLETSYRYFTNFGIEYRFGSIFNNVVNPRFGPGGRVFITG
jgi:hypothetical protein